MIVAARQVALEHGDVKVTTGVIKPQTSSINVIPEDVTFSLDVRAADDATQDATVAAIREQYAAIAGGEGVDVSVDEQWRVPPTPFDPGIRDLAEQLCLERGYAWRRLLGGIGHDSQNLAQVTRAAMLFTPTVGGLSHCQTEASTWPEIVQATDVLLGLTLSLANN